MQWPAIAAMVISLTTLSLTALSMRRSARKEARGDIESRIDDLERSEAECQKTLKNLIGEKNDLLYEVLELRRKIDDVTKRHL